MSQYFIFRGPLKLGRSTMACGSRYAARAGNSGSAFLVLVTWTRRQSPGLLGHRTRLVCAFVSRGAAYIANTEDPDAWKQIPITPVLDVRSIPERQLLLFADFTRLAVYGRQGLIWRSPRLCWDELKILKITDATIEGVGYDPTSQSGELRFVVDTNTGCSLVPPPQSADGKSLW
jgi:hypothetical protein